MKNANQRHFIFVLLLACLAPFNGKGQLPTLTAGFSLGSTLYQNGDAIAIDGSGNTFVTGYFENTVDFDPGAGTANLTASSHDIFFAKYSSTGVYQWAWKVGGASYDQGTGVAVDASGNAFFCGYFAGNVDFNPGAGASNLNSSNDDAFVTKYDAAGNFQWAFKIGGTGYDMAHALSTDAAGNVYVTGYFAGTVDFDPSASTFNLTSTGWYDGYVAKYSTAGTLVWAFRIGGSLSDEYGYDINATSGDLYVTGSFSSTVDFDPGAGVVNRTNVSGNDIWLAKYTQAGAYQWVVTLGSNSTDDGTGIGVDAAGNVYLGGGFEFTVDFDPGAGVSNLTSAGSLDQFLAKFTSAGAFVWALRNGSTGSDYVQKIATDPAGNTVIGGYFNNTVDFDPSAAVYSLVSAGGYESVNASYDASGNLRWAFRIGGANFDMTYDVDINGCYLAITGYYEGTVDMDPNAGTSNITSLGGFDAFVGLYNYCPLVLPNGFRDFSVETRESKPLIAWVNEWQSTGTYQLWRINDRGAASLIHEATALGSEFVFTDAHAEAGSVQYRLELRDAAGKLMQSETLDYFHSVDESIILFPNPSLGKFHLQFNGEFASMQIIDLRGIVLHTMASVKPGVIDLTERLSTGVYTLRLVQENGQTQSARLLIR